MRRWLVQGYSWLDGGVFLRVRGDRDHKIANRALTGAICLLVTDERRCLGFQDDGRLVACPARATPSGKRCDACQARDEFRPCMTCRGVDCPRLSHAMLRYCRQMHHLYLACFGDAQLKVGTASDPRRNQRIIEQGPLAAARVAASTGPRIKQMEHLLVQAGFTETMRRTKKMALLRGAMTTEQAEALVREAAAGVSALLPDEYRAELHAPIFVEQPSLARVARGQTVNAMPVQPNTVLEGQVIGAVGHVLFIEDGDGRFAVDLGELVGRIVVFDPLGPQSKPVVQLGLF